MFEIWQHTESGRRYLVITRGGMVTVAAGPLGAHDDPRRVLETHGNQNHNPQALIDIRRTPAAYRREYTTDTNGHAVEVSRAAQSTDSPASLFGQSTAF